MRINALVLFFFLLAQSFTPPHLQQTQSNLPESPSTLGQPYLFWQINGGCVTGPYCETGWYSSPAVADVNKDDKIEVIAGDYSLFILNAVTGDKIKTIPISINDRIWSDVVVADLQHDGNLEIVVANEAGVIDVYNYTYNLLWSRTVPGNVEVTSLAVADIDGDGNLEVIAGSIAGNKQWMVYKSNGDPYPLPWPQLDVNRPGNPGNALGCYNENLAAADMNGDGHAEIIGPNDTNYIDAFYYDGSQIPANSMFGTNTFWSQVSVNVNPADDTSGTQICHGENRANFGNSAPIITDLDGDGTLETVVVGNIYNCATPDQHLYQVPFIFNSDRTRWNGSGYNWTVLPTPDSKAKPLSEDDNTIKTVMPNPVAADLDGDGHMEILYPSYDGRLHAYWLDKTEHGSWPFSVYKPTDGYISFASEPVVADLNGDGKGEVIFTTWTQLHSNHYGKLYILDYLGNLLFSVDLPAPVGAANWNGAMAAPTLADLDGNHQLEVVVNTVFSGVVAYKIPGSQTTGIIWGTGRGSYQRSGVSTGNLSTTRTQVSPHIPHPGDTLTYSIKLNNPGLLLSNVTLTDTLSSVGQSYITGSLTWSSGFAHQSGGVIYWTGAVGLTPVTISFQEVIPPDLVNPTRLTSTVVINDNQGSLYQRGTSVWVNGKYLFLPLITH